MAKKYISNTDIIAYFVSIHAKSKPLCFLMNILDLKWLIKVGLRIRWTSTSPTDNVLTKEPHPLHLFHLVLSSHSIPIQQSDHVHVVLKLGKFLKLCSNERYYALIKTLPKALWTQAFTALTSNFGLVGLVQHAWLG